MSELFEVLHQSRFSSTSRKVKVTTNRKEAYEIYDRTFKTSPLDDRVWIREISKDVIIADSHPRK